MVLFGQFLEILIGGLLSGVLYSLVALGFVLIFKASGVFNFAQGAMVLLADFSGARVYVHGAAFVPTQNKNGYRSGKMIQNLESFWKTYFSKSNADLAGFGNPELTIAVE